MKKKRCISIFTSVLGLLLLTSCAPRTELDSGLGEMKPPLASTPAPSASAPQLSAPPDNTPRMQTPAQPTAQSAPEKADETAAQPSPTQAIAAQPSPSQTAAPQPIAAKTEPVSKTRAKISPTTRMSYRELVADNKNYKTPRTFPSKGTYRIHVDLTNQIMTVYKHGDIVRQMLCSTGKRDTPSPHGKYRMGRDRVRFGFFKNFDCYAQYWTQVTRNIYIHSVLYSKKSDKTLIRASYRNLGKAVSHGCIRLTVPDARWIYQNIAPGTVIEFGRRSKNEALRKELKLPPIPSSKKK